MAGNSQRRGSMRKPGTKKGAVAGSGGQRAKGLRGKGATPPAEMRPGHPAQRRAARSERTDGGRSRRRLDTEPGETVLGRGPVLECLRAGVPATALHVAVDMDSDDRVTDSLRLAADRGVSILEVPRSDLDRITGGALHQGLALQVPPYAYVHPDDVLAAAQSSGAPGLIVALDGVTDPRVLGSVVRSAVAFGAHGVLLPARRSIGMTAVAWRTSAGAAARLPVARTPNLTRALKDVAAAGLMVLGLDAAAGTPVDGLDLITGPLVVVLGSQGRGLSRLVREACDMTASIPVAGSVESLNAAVAAGVALAEVARLRRTG